MEPHHRWLCARRIAVEGDDCRAHASGRRPPPPARYGQNDPEIAMGRKAWLFTGSELAGQRAAVVMSLLQSAKLHGHDPWAYLKDVLTRLPSHIGVGLAPFPRTV